MTAVIATRAMCTGYAGQPVVHDLDLEVNSGELVVLLGPNGAGKTTTMLALAGELPVMSGEVLFDGQVTKAPLHRRARAGMSYVTEERSVFRGLSTRDNLRVAGIDPGDACKLFPELEKRMSVRGGLLSLEEACTRYTLTVEEFLAWQYSIDRHGLAGLRTTRIQQYRQ